MTTLQPERARAPRLDPDVRRQSILDAAVEIFLDRGPNFTTSDVAGAVGVSEATVFRYFQDKSSLMEATRDAILGLDVLLPQLEAASKLPTLAERVAAAAHALSPRIDRTSMLLQSMDAQDPRRKDSISELLAALAPLFADAVPSPTAQQLAGVFLGTMIINTAMGARAGVEPVTVDQLVSLVLYGVTPRDDV